MLHLLPLAAFAVSASAAGLNTAAKAAGLKYFGSATDNPEFSDAPYVAELSNTDDFGQITPGNTQKWVYTEPSQNSFSWTQGDAVVSLAQSNNQLVRCHNLVWYNELPNWITSGSWTNATLQAALKNHITAEVTHYKGKCYAWDVVNEALSDSGGYRSNIFYQIIGPAYIPLAFKWAAAADPDVKLYYNDYNIESAGTKSSQAQDIVRMIKAYGAKIDGVGLQGHFIVGSTPSTAAQVSNMQAFTALGVEVAITELDIRMTLPSTPALLAQQGTDYASTTTACLKTKGCVGITVWDYTDKYSWVPGTFSGQGAACPWDSNLAKKPAYASILSALGGGASPTSSSSVVPPTSKPTTSPTTMKTTTSPTTTGPSPTATAGQWGQCGGNGWTGPTACPVGWTCKAQNAYYSQCLQ